MAGPDAPVLVDVSTLNDLPVCTRFASKKLAKMMSEKAKSDPGSIGPMMVGRVGSVNYVINELEIFSGLQSSKISQVQAFVTEYPSMRDLVVAHVRENFNPHMIDPLRLPQIIDYLVGDGMDVQEAYRLLWLDRRPELLGALQCDIIDEARKVLQDMMDEISKKMYAVVTPVYFMTRLARIVTAEQHRAALEIKSLTMSKMISDAKSSWPVLDTIDSTLKSFHKKTNGSDPEDRVCTYGDTKDLTKKKKKKPTKEKSAKDKSMVKKAEKYIKSDPNLLYVPLEGEHPDLLVNKKTGRVAVAEERDGVYSMTDDLGQSIYTLPKGVMEYIGVDAESIHIYKFITLEKAQKALAKATKTQRCVILTPSSIPRR